MRLFITCDAWWETKMDKVLDALNNTEYDRFFDKQDYGDSPKEIAIILMCRQPYLKFKQRIRFSKKENSLFMDIMLDLNQFMDVDQKVRNTIVAEKLIAEVPQIIAKYKFKDFDLLRFEKDLKRYMKKVNKENGIGPVTIVWR